MNVFGFCKCRVFSCLVGGVGGGELGGGTEAPMTFLRLYFSCDAQTEISICLK